MEFFLKNFENVNRVIGTPGAIIRNANYTHFLQFIFGIMLSFFAPCLGAYGCVNMDGFPLNSNFLGARLALVGNTTKTLK